MSAKPVILLVEDDAHLSFGIAFNLEKEGYEVVAAGSAESAEEAVLQRAPDLAIFDIMLPKRSGIDLLGDVRRRGLEFPVIMLTARSDESDAVTALSLGADDYVRKPFGLAELLARIATILRRRTAATQSGNARAVLGEWTIDLLNLRAEGARGERTLTTIEAEILGILIDARGAVVRREDLLRRIWGLDHRSLTRTLDNHVARLRKKLEPDPQAPRLVITVFGTGYKAAIGGP